MKKNYLNLYLVTDSDLALGRPVEDVVQAAVRGGTTIVQLREKTASTRDFYHIALRVKEILQGTGVPLIINDRLDIAQAVDVEGLHIGQSDMPYEIARRILGPNKIIGVSCDNDEQLLEMNRYDDVNYVAVQAYGTQTKAEADHPLGSAGVLRSKKLTRHPLVAIGGIHLSNAAEISEAEADGIAVVSEIMSAKDPEDAAKKLYLQLGVKNEK